MRCKAKWAVKDSNLALFKERPDLALREETGPRVVLFEQRYLFDDVVKEQLRPLLRRPGAQPLKRRNLPETPNPTYAASVCSVPLPLPSPF